MVLFETGKRLIPLSNPQDSKPQIRFQRLTSKNYKSQSHPFCYSLRPQNEDELVFYKLDLPFNLQLIWT